MRIPDHWRSTQWQTEQYLRSTQQAKQFRERQSRRRRTVADRADDYLPSEPLEVVESLSDSHVSYRKKIAATVLALGVVVAPSAQFAEAGADHNAAGETAESLPEGDDCYVLSESSPQQQAVETFTYSNAGNDVLSKHAQAQVAAEFRESHTFNAIEEHLATIPQNATISIAINGIASDDNRQNFNAGIGEKDEINTASARAYAALATDAIKNVLNQQSLSATVAQTAQERILSQEQQYRLTAVQQAAELSTPGDLLTAYNTASTLLSEQQRQVVDQLIGENRGVEVTVSTLIPEIHTEHLYCSRGSEALDGENALESFDQPQVILPTWSRVQKGHPDAWLRRHKDRQTHRRRKERRVRRSQSLKSRVITDSKSLVATARNTITTQLSDAKKFARIPSADLHRLTRPDFYARYREFPEDVHRAKRRLLTRFIQRLQ